MTTIYSCNSILLFTAVCSWQGGSAVRVASGSEASAPRGSVAPFPIQVSGTAPRGSTAPGAPSISLCAQSGVAGARTGRLGPQWAGSWTSPCVRLAAPGAPPGIAAPCRRSSSRGPKTSAGATATALLVTERAGKHGLHSTR